MSSMVSETVEIYAHFSMKPYKKMRINLLLKLGEFMQQISLKASFDVNRANKMVIDEMCDLISKHFGITFVGYLRLYFDGTAQAFSNDLSWQEYFLNKVDGNSKSFEIATFSSQAQKKPYLHIWPNLHLDKTLEALKAHNIWNGISLYRTHKEFIDSWSFAGTREEVGLINLFVNHTYIFNKFISYVEKKYAFLFEENRSAQFKFAAHTENSNGPSLQISNASIQSFISSNLLFKRIFNAQGREIAISPREREVLFLIQQGLRMNEIADHLGISNRTVEHHQLNLRRKFECTSTSQLLKYL